MFTAFKQMFKLKSQKDKIDELCENSLFLRGLIGFLEDVLFWNNKCLSTAFVLVLNILFLFCIWLDINFLEFIFSSAVLLIAVDCFEMWLRFKHRTNFLKNINHSGGMKLYRASVIGRNWLIQKSDDYFTLRDVNHTKAFLLVNIVLSTIFVVGKYLSGKALLYILLMFISTYRVLAPPVMQLIRRVQVVAESDSEIESLIPVLSEHNLNELNFDTETDKDDRQSSVPDYWLPENEPPDETSDSSDNSDSIVTNLSVAKTCNLDNEGDSTSDSGDEYMPDEQQEILQPSLDVTPVVTVPNTWSSVATNAFWNLTEAVMGKNEKREPEIKFKRVSSAESSDSFEIIEKSDLL